MQRRRVQLYENPMDTLTVDIYNRTIHKSVKRETSHLLKEIFWWSLDTPIQPIKDVIRVEMGGEEYDSI